MENSDPLDTAQQAYVQHPQNNLVKARRLLLDVVQALHAQVEALVVIGAQAIYERTWHLPIDGLDLATADADFAVDPSLVVTAPQIESVMATSGFTHHPSRPGVWRYDDTGAGIDFLVPELFAGKGTRSAKVPGQAKNSIGRAAGLELALFDKSMMSIGSYEQGDPRTLRLKVAGSAALLCAKSFKLHERFSDHARPDRVRPKDATDVYRRLPTICNI